MNQNPESVYSTFGVLSFDNMDLTKEHQIENKISSDFYAS